MANTTFRRKVKITGILTFETAFHIGSGHESELGSDMGVLRDILGRPILPGSTLKGNFRTMAERLSAFLGLKACMLDSNLSGFNCVNGDENYRRSVKGQLDKLSRGIDKVAWLKGYTCDICQFFGSPMQASRIFFSDGELDASSWPGVYEIRDGVGLDRDSETARHGVKYDFEVVPSRTAFNIAIELENPEPSEMALVAAVMAEWETGFRLGGFTSRGLGRVKLEKINVEDLDYSDPEQLHDYLLLKKMKPNMALLDNCLQEMLKEAKNNA